MAINLSKVKARLNNVKRNLYYESTEPLRLYNVNRKLLELESGWYMPTQITSNLAIGAEYWDLFIADVTDEAELEDFLTNSSGVEINGEKYRIISYVRPRGATQQWHLRLESTGEKV